MNIGKLYQNKKYFCFLYPSKEIASAPPAVDNVDNVVWKCNSYISPNGIFVLLDQDGEFLKILSTNGELGWIKLPNWCKDDIEEVTI